MSTYLSLEGVYFPEPADITGSQIPLLEKLRSKKAAVQQLADQDKAILCHPAANKLYSADRIRERRTKLLAEVEKLDSDIFALEALEGVEL